MNFDCFFLSIVYEFISIECVCWFFVWPATVIKFGNSSVLRQWKCSFIKVNIKHKTVTIMENPAHTECNSKNVAIHEEYLMRFDLRYADVSTSSNWYTSFESVDIKTSSVFMRWNDEFCDSCRSHLFYVIHIECEREITITARCRL